MPDRYLTHCVAIEEEPASATFVELLHFIAAVALPGSSIIRGSILDDLLVHGDDLPDLERHDLRRGKKKKGSA